MKKAKLVCGLLLFLGIGIRPGALESAGLETSSDNEDQNPTGPFECFDGKEIDRKLVCDGNRDCVMSETNPGGEDENDCEQAGQETSSDDDDQNLTGPFECFDGKEIDIKLVCDGNRDCAMSETNPGGEDEKDCEQAGQETSSDDDDQNLTGPFEYFDGEEIDRTQVCDGIRDCAISQTYPGGEDEKDCELPSPRIVIVGGTGVGKSSLANSLLGLDPELDNALFEVCEHLDSCTKETKYGIGQWLGKGKKFTVVDTFGFADSDDQDLELLPRMINVLKNQIKSAQAIIFAIKGTETRFHKGLQEMLTQMSAIFGDRWWEYMILGVSFWKFDEASIKERERRCPGRFCKNEEWFRDQIQKQLKEKFKLEQNITMAFLHSYSQTAYNIEDEIQQQHWKDETQILWDFATAKDKPFEFKDVDDIIQENTRNKREIERLNNVINKKITALETVVSTIPDEIIALQTVVSTIPDEITALQTLVSTIPDEITTLQTVVSTIPDEITALKTVVSTLPDEITALKTVLFTIPDEITALKTVVSAIPGEITALQTDLNQTMNQINHTMINQFTALDQTMMNLVPLGTILSWVTKPTNAPDTEMLSPIPPDGWVKCDGGRISKGIWKDKLTPDLNGGRRFLRGGREIDMLKMEEDILKEHKHDLTDTGHNHDIDETGHMHDIKDYGHTHAINDKLHLHNNVGGTEDNHNGLDKQSYRDKYNSGGNFHMTNDVCPISSSTDSVKTGISRTENKTTGIKAIKTTSGIRLGNVSPSSTSGEETRPKNMAVIYIMKVY